MGKLATVVVLTKKPPTSIGGGSSHGYPDGIVNPKGEITRAETAKMLCNLSGQIFNAEGKYTKDTDGNVLVNTPDVILKDMVVSGDLYLTEGIEQGDVTLDNIIVKGRTYIKGGGENSINIIKSKLGEIIVKKEDKKVRIVIDENTDISNIIIYENTILTIKKGAKIELIKVKGETSIEVEKGAKVGKIEIESKNVEIKAEGNIDSVTSTEDVKINDEMFKKGKEVKVDSGRAMTEPLSGGSSSGGSSGGSSSGTTTVAVSAITVNPTTMDLTVGGATKTIVATVLPADATNKNVTWTSANTAVATVLNGVVSPVGAGTTTITATSVDGVGKKQQHQ